MERHYKEKVEDIKETDWSCYYCQGICSCAFCRRRRAKETNTKFESHRGKKKRIHMESPEDNSPRKRKSTDCEKEEFTPQGKKNNKDYEQVEKVHKRNNHSRNKPSPKRRRITLKDLIDHEILLPNDELVFRDTELARLLPDGQVQWNQKTFKTLADFTKQASLALGLPLDIVLSPHSWDQVYCRGKVLTLYRQQFLKITDSNCYYIGDEEDDDFGDDERGDSNSNSNSNSNDEEGDEDTRGTTEDSTGKDESDLERLRDLIEDTVLAGHEIKHRKDKSAEPVTKEEEESSQSSWWLEDEEEEVHSPVHQLLLDDIYLFSVSSTSLCDDEKDLLVLGNNRQAFLEIDDKDFFNISSTDESDSSGEERIYKNPKNLQSYRETVADFYSGNVGIDSEYF